MRSVLRDSGTVCFARVGALRSPHTINQNSNTQVVGSNDASPTGPVVEMLLTRFAATCKSSRFACLEAEVTAG